MHVNIDNIGVRFRRYFTLAADLSYMADGRLYVPESDPIIIDFEGLGCI